MAAVFGRVLVVDAGSGAHRTIEVPDEVNRAYLGGVGLGTWLLHELADPATDPLGEEAVLAFVFSPLVGTPLTTSAKFAVVARSPLTGMLNDALASSHFAIAGKLTGHDAIAITGHREGLGVLTIEGDRVEIRDGTHLAGRSAADTEQAVGDELGAGWRVAAIGPAGEAGVRYATISHDGRHAGRGGLGAVLGAKGLKAVAVKAATKVLPADPEGVLAAAKDLRERSFGPATAKYRELGTLSNLLAFNAINNLPTNNFATATFENAPNLAAEELHEMRQVARNSCASCSIGCEYIYSTGRGDAGVRVEYENVFALGPLCGVSDPDAVLSASARCDELGIDTISAGGTIAWAMSCAEAGIIDEPWLRFGDPAALLRALDELANNTGIGPLLALGSRAAAIQIGGDAVDHLVTVKGLELPGYDPRTLPAMAVGLAVNARGADHNRSGAYEADLAGALDRFNPSLAHVDAALQTEDRAALIDSMILCRFLRGVFEDPMTEWAELLRLVTGWDLDAAELAATAERIVIAKRMYNLRAGWRPEDDQLPDRLLDTPVELSSGRRVTLDRDIVTELVGAYHRARGLDECGRPDRSVWENLQITAPYPDDPGDPVDGSTTPRPAVTSQGVR